MGQIMMICGYLIKGWRRAVKSSMTDLKPTKAICNTWIEMALTQIWLFMEGAWQERNETLHNGKYSNIV